MPIKMLAPEPILGMSAVECLNRFEDLKGQRRTLENLWQDIAEQIVNQPIFTTGRPVPQDLAFKTLDALAKRLEQHA